MEVDELYKKAGVLLTIEKYGNVYWLKRFEYSETPGDSVMEWRCQ